MSVDEALRLALPVAAICTALALSRGVVAMVYAAVALPAVIALSIRRGPLPAVLKLVVATVTVAFMIQTAQLAREVLSIVLEGLLVYSLHLDLKKATAEGYE